MTAGATRRVPLVTLILLTANLVAAVALLAYPDFAYTLGFRSDAPSVRDMVTSLFLHANLFHLLGNMIFLAAVGAAAEIATGAIRFSFVYFLSGFFGVAAHYAMTRHLENPEPYIGASGAIAGCVGYYAVRYASLRVHLAPGMTGSLLLVTITWVVLQGLGAFVHIGESGGVAFWAHLGGFATGIVLCLIFRSPDPGQRELSRQRVVAMEERGHEAVAEMARRHLREHPDDLAAMVSLANALELVEGTEEEVDLRVKLVERDDPEGRDGHWERLLELGRADAVPLHRRMREADRIARDNPDLADRLLTTVVGERLPDALLARAAIWRDRDAARAESLLADLCEDHPMSAAAATAKSRGWCA